MAINFPDNPTIGDEFTANTGRTWVWTGSTWKSKTVNLDQYINDTTNVHGISNTANLAYLSDLESKQDLVPNVTSQEIGYLDGVTSNIQTQLSDKADSVHEHNLSDIQDVTASSSEVNILDGAIITTQELNYLAGAASSIQDQIDDKANASHTHVVADLSDVQATPIEINYLSGATGNIQNQINSKSASGHTHLLANVTDVTATSSEVNVLDGVTATTSEINYLSGVTSSIQTQINAKASSTHTHLVADVTDITASASELNILDGATLTTTELNYVDGVTSAIQTQLNAKAPLAAPAITGNATAENLTITGNLTVQGTTTTVAATNLEVTDSLIYLAAEQYNTDTLDIGIFGAYGDAQPGHLHTGFVRDATDAKWKLVSGAAEPTDSHVDFTGVTYDTLKIGALETAGITATGAVDLSAATVSGVSLDELSDVTQTSATSGDVLYFDGSGWVNRYINAVPAIRATPSLTSNNYNLVASDAGKIIEINNSSANATVTIPSSESFAVGTQIVIMQTAATYDLVVQVQNSGTQTLNANPGFKLRGQWAAATLLKRASNTWVLYGDIKV